MKERLNNFWYGLIIGIGFPAFFFMCYWLFLHSYMSFPRAFLNYLTLGGMLSNVIKLCAISNLLLFYLFLNAKMNSAAKGIIAATVCYLGIVLYVLFYIE